jgi:hypothetical protein
MDIAPDYYSLLGISASDDLEHITSAYKKLAKKYHPDTSLLPKREAEEKFKAISAAYRLARLAKTGSQKPEIYPGNPSSTNAKPTPPPSARPASAVKEDTWITFCARNRTAKHLHDELGRISPILSEEFRYAVLADGSPDGLQEIASILEEEYLSKYFGANPKVQRLAKWLIVSANVAVAAELNRVVISNTLPKNLDKFMREFVMQRGLNYVIPDDAATDSRDTIDFILDFSSQMGIFGSFFVVSVVLSFTSGVLTASLFTSMHVDKGVLLICSAAFALCLVSLIIMLPILLRAARRHQP